MNLEDFLVPEGQEQAQNAGDLEQFLVPLEPEDDQSPPAQQEAVLTNKIGAIIDGIAQGQTFGFSDEIAAALASATGLGGEFGEFDKNLEAERARMAENKRLAGGFELGGQVLGGLSTGLGLAKSGLLASAKLPMNAGLGSRATAAAIDGGVAGALFGAGTGDGLVDRAQGTVSGGLTGATIGGAIPVVASVAKSVASPVVNAVKARISPEQFAVSKVAERLANDGTDLAQVQRRVGDGLNIADVAGEGTRDLLRSVTNLPGNARNRITASLTLRQIGQGDRLKSAISKTFADPDSFLTVKDDLAESAANLARPLYEEAYANPVPFSRSLEKILNTAAGKKALRKATEIASNEQVPFAQWFANVADDGSVSIKRVPDMRAWDYIKRGMDDVIEGQTDKITRKVTNSGRAVIGLKNRMLNELDRANPAYAEARRTFSGFAQIDDALEFGKTSTRLSPDAVRRKLATMSASEKEAARIGAAEALRKQIDDAGFTNNAIRRIMGNRSQFQRLKALFDNPSQFKAFRKEIFAEARKQKTFEAIRGNSTTARQLLDAQDAGQIQQAGSVFADAAQGNIGRVISGITNIAARAGGLTPEVADNIGRQLTGTNPAQLQKLMTTLRTIEGSTADQVQRNRLIQDVLSRVTIGQTVPQLAGQ